MRFGFRIPPAPIAGASRDEPGIYISVRRGLRTVNGLLMQTVSLARILDMIGAIYGSAGPMAPNRYNLQRAVLCGSLLPMAPPKTVEAVQISYRGPVTDRSFFHADCPIPRCRGNFNQ